MNDIIPPSMTQGAEIFVSYMDPIRNKDNSWTISLTIHTVPPKVQMIATAEFRVLTRDVGIALGEAIKQIVVQVVPPPIHTANGN
jgi:hypothetical protein